MKGNEIRPNSVSYVTLAKIRHQEGDYEAVDSLCEKAHELAINPGERKFVYQQIMQLYAEQKRYDKAIRASKAFMKVWDTEALQREQHDVRNVQAAYDYKMKELRIQEKNSYYVLGSILLVLALAIVILYFRYRKNQQVKESEQNKLLVNNYLQQMKELEEEHKDLEKRIQFLTNRISNFQGEQPKILYEGHKLYNHIVDGGTTAGWGDDEFFYFVEYYRMIDFSFVAHLEDDYNNLSTSDMMRMILFHMDKSDKEVAKIIGVAEESLPSASCPALR